MLKLLCDIPPMPTANLREFFFGKMYLGVRKVCQAPRMIGIGVRENDMLNLLWPKAETFDLPNRGVWFVELETGEFDQLLSQSTCRISNIKQANACIN